MTPGGPKSHWEDPWVIPGGAGGALGGPKCHWEDLGVTAGRPWGALGGPMGDTMGGTGRTQR